MNKLYTLTISLILILKLATAQVPQGFKYQTAIRDNNGAVLANKLVSIKLSLLTGSASGTVIYSEVHKVATNDFGVANLNVGNGTANLGNFNTMDWGSNTFFLKTEVDINNGTNFTFMGSSQLLSVPFAMYAAKSANAADDRDKDSLNEIQNISLNNNSLQLNKNGGSVDLTKYDKDSQQLVLNGNTLSITKGNSIVLSGSVDLDADPTNEIQNLSLSKDTLKLSNANYVVLPKDNDTDSTNEIQSLSVNQNKLIISKSNQVNIDADTTNEIQSLQQNGNTITLSKTTGTIDVAKTTNVQNGSILYASASGNNAINLTLSPAPTAYTAGMIINFKATASNTGAVSINLNGLGAKQLFKNIVDSLEANDLATNQMTSIIYDGFNFQFLATPFAKKANKLASDSTVGLVPKNALISTESIEPPPGFVYSGNSFQTGFKSTILNNDSSNLNLIGIDNSCNLLFYSFNYVSQTVSISKFDTISNTFTHLTNKILNTLSNVSGYTRVQSIYSNNSIFFIHTSGEIKIPNNPPYSIRLCIEEYNISTNNWIIKFINNNTSATEYFNGLGNKLGVFNNNLFFYLNVPELGNFLNNTNRSIDMYRLDLSSNNLSRVLNSDLETSNYGKYMNGNLFYFSNDSIYKLNNSFNFIYQNKFGNQNKSNNGLTTANYLCFYKDYIFNSLNNTIANKISPFKLNTVFLINNKLYVTDGYPYISNFYLSDTLLNISSKIALENKIQEYTIEQIFYKNNNKALLIDKDGNWNTILEVTLPKTFYYHKKL
jgi:hypothetical protein